jgi:hypothetical protein
VQSQHDGFHIDRQDSQKRRWGGGPKQLSFSYEMTLVDFIYLGANAMSIEGDPIPPTPPRPDLTLDAQAVRTVGVCFEGAGESKVQVLGAGRWRRN